MGRVALPPSPRTPPVGGRFGPDTFGRSASKRLAKAETDWVAPSLEKALEYADTMHPRTKDKYTGKKVVKFSFCGTRTGHFCTDSFVSSGASLLCLCCCCDSPRADSQFEGFGSGVANFFRHVKALAALCWAMTIIYIPVMVLNTWGAGTNTGTETIGLDVLTLGNLGDGTNTTKLYIPFTSCGDEPCALKKEDAAVVYGVSDALATLVCILGFWFIHKRLGKMDSAENLSIEDYTIRVRPLPRDATEEQVRNHFEKATGGRVAEVVLAEDVADLMRLLKRRGKAIRRLEAAMEEIGRLRSTGSSGRVLERAQKRARKVEEEVRKLTKRARDQSSEGRVLEGYVTFYTMDDANHALLEYGNGSSARQACLPRRLRIPPIKTTGPMARRKKKGIGSRRRMVGEVEFAQPACMLCPCDCLDCACCHCPCDRRPHLLAPSVTRAPAPSTILWRNLVYDDCSRRARAAVSGTASLLLLAISFALAIWASVEQRSALEVGGSKPCPTDNGGRTLHVSRSQAEDDSSILHCYCQDIPLEQAATDSLCHQWAAEQSQALSTALAAAAAIPIINSLLSLVFQAFAKFEKHHSLEDRDSALGIRLLIATFLNTGIVILIVNAAIGNFSLPGASYRDFNSAWYANVGASITVTMILNIVSPHVYSLGLAMYSHHCVRTAATVAKAKSQRELNEKFVGMEFRLPMRYAQAINGLAVTLLYSSGIPFLVPIACASFIVHYLVDKYLFVSFYRTPAKSDARLGRNLFNVIPFFLVLHSAFGVWMLGNEEIFRSKVVDAGVSASGSDPQEVQTGFDRATQLHTLPLFILFALLVIALVFRFVLLTFFGVVSRLIQLFFCGLCSASDLIKNNDVPFETLDEARRDKRWVGRNTFSMMEDTELTDALGIHADYATRKSVRRLRDLIRAPVGQEDDGVGHARSLHEDFKHADDDEYGGDGGALPQHASSIAAPGAHVHSSSQHQSAVGIEPDGSAAEITLSDGSILTVPTFIRHADGQRIAFVSLPDGSQTVVELGPDDPEVGAGSGAAGVGVGAGEVELELDDGTIVKAESIRREDGSVVALLPRADGSVSEIQIA